MTGVVRCSCGEIVSIESSPSGCPACGRHVRALRPVGTGEPAEEVQEFLSESPDDREVRSTARKMLEALLDPRAIQWLLALGGSLGVIGLIIWAYSKRLFDSPLQQAALFGVGTIGFFVVGWWLSLRTRHRLAGEAITFLAGVVAPLNLWFYHAQGLVTVDGHLWMAGLVCCALYAATLFLLRRPVFLYAFQIGVTLTVLLLLAHFGEVGVIGLSITLAILGATAVHLERAFPGDGPFARTQFGPPLLWTGLVQFGLALVLLLPVQIFAWLELPATMVSWLIDPARLDVSPLAAVGLWLAGAYVAFYLALVPRVAGGWTVLAAAAFLLMAETTVLIGANASAEGAIVALALTAAVACVMASRLSETSGVPHRIAITAAVAASFLSVLFGYLLLARGAMLSFRVFGWDRPIDASFSLAMTLASACLAASAVAMRPHRRAAAVLRFLTAGGVLLAASGAMQLLEMAPWSIRAAVLTLIPLAYLIEGTLRKDDVDVAIGHTAFGFFGLSMFIAVCHQGLGLFLPEEGKIATLGLAIIAVEVAAFLLTTAIRAERSGERDGSAFASLLAAGGITIATWQGLGFAGAIENGTVATFTAIALLTLAVSRITATVRPVWSRPFFVCGAALLFGTVAMADLKGFGLLAIGELGWRHCVEAAAVSVGAVVAAALAPSRIWRRGFLVAAGLSAGVTVLLISSLADLTGWQRLEVLAATAGTLLLVAGHVARFREEAGRQDDLVDAALWLGGAMLTLPIAATVLYHRVEMPPSLIDELALVTFGVLMLASGVVFRSKATTLFGGSAIAGYLVVLIAGVLRRPEVTMGAYLAAAGAALFFAGLGLSLYRDRLLTLPNRVARREGVFRILDWR